MKTLKDFLKENDLLTEVKLSRLWTHLAKNSAAVGIITAFRGDKSEKENVANNKVIASKVRKAGFGFSWVDGAWRENEGTDKEMEVSEVSLFITGDDSEALLNLLMDCAKRYNQDGFVYKAPGAGEKIQVLDKKGKVLLGFSNVKMDKMNDIYTKIRGGSHGGRSFFFESARTPLGFYGRLAIKKEDRHRFNDCI
jgi:hypothetical protein